MESMEEVDDDLKAVVLDEVKRPVRRWRSFAWPMPLPRFFQHIQKKQ